MADATYQPKVYRKPGGDEQVVASGGLITVESGGEVDIESGGLIKVAANGGLTVAGVSIQGATIALVTADADEINKLDGIPATSYLVAQEVMLFTQTTGNGTYTGTIALPAGSIILDVAVHGIAIWDASTSASLIVGDDADPDGFFKATNLKATDLLAGEVNNIEHPGGLAGDYIALEQRILYAAGARNIIGVVTQVGTGSTGRTLLVVTYAVPVIGAATKV